LKILLLNDFLFTLNFSKANPKERPNRVIPKDPAAAVTIPHLHMGISVKLIP
jgi:hypothetical protein